MTTGREHAPGGAPESPSLQRARAAGLRWSAQTALTLLVVDPGLDVTETDAKTLAVDGVNVSRCVDGAAALLHIGRHEPDIILLAAELAEVSAATVVRAVRSVSSVPILVGSGAEDTQAAGAALLAGATTLVQRPYMVEELTAVLDRVCASIEARLRSRSVLAYGPLELDPLKFTARLNGVDLSLPLKEFELLGLLMRHADHVVSVDQIREVLWGPGPDRPRSNAVFVHVAKLRARLGGPRILRTVRGFGYRLTFSDSSLPDAADA